MDYFISEDKEKSAPIERLGFLLVENYQKVYLCFIDAT